ncbi:EpsG family protein [Novosphingobium aquimarinum]|uniref:EpsG family protein n=1 Tax=Novosphingobium aquimarinum TaxID=2682494 RepID=UPI0012EC9F39|nr:EpsG family protein [Novosphingobium aquimarinum]
MLIYWLFLGFIALMALVEQGDREVSHRANFVWVVFAIALILFMGGRWRTGGDWGNYYLGLEPFYWLMVDDAAASSKDVGFTVLSIFASWFPTGIVVITMFTGIVLGIALTIFSLAQPRPWLCMMVAFPYFVVVCGMGYMRQGIAISFILMGLLALERERVGRYTAWVATGALFHATALVMIPLGAIVSRRNRLIVIAFVIVMTILAFRTLLASRADSLVNNYVEADAESAGALVRAMMSAVPGAIFLLFRRHFALARSPQLAWTALAIAAVAAVPAVEFFPSSTVIDRLGLYLLPLQFFVWSRVPDALATSVQQRQVFGLLIVLLYIVIFFTFVNYADHADAWFPYRFWLFEDGLCLECGSPRDF